MTATSDTAQQERDDLCSADSANNSPSMQTEEVSDAVQRITEWSNQIKKHESVSWERMPEIDLYMDQVLTYMDKQLNLFQRDESSKLLTSSMINNYVKDGLLPRPDHKKYSRDHLAAIMIICMLKQVLSIPDISTLSKSLLTDTPVNKLHDSFCAKQNAALSEICGRVDQCAKLGESELKHLALTLSIEANARRIAAERILSELADKMGAKK